LKIYSKSDLDLIEHYHVLSSRADFYSYRKYLNYPKIKLGFFIEDVARNLQQFYEDMVAGKRPFLVIQAPPQHGKSFSITDFASFFMGQAPENRIIYASFSDRLGIRANRTLQRTFETNKFKAIFPDFKIGTSRAVTVAGKLLLNNEIIETSEEGYFRNTTVNGSVTGEGLDLGIIDDPIKGRKEANSKVIRNGAWDWLTDDFMSRFSEYAGLLMILTRWHIDDPAGRLIDKMGDKVKILKYPAINEFDEPLFPEHKSLEFLLERKAAMQEENWQSLYQQNPVLKGGNIIKSDWWVWGDVRPRLKNRFITADTAQKKNNWNDWTVFQAWGECYDGKIHLLDQFRGRVEAPELRELAKEFYDRHNGISGEPLRGMYIEDKSSGTGLIQELKKFNLKIEAIPRTIDKITRSQDVGPEIKSGKVILYKDVSDVEIIVDEGAAFPNGINDDAFDCTMTAVEVAYLNGTNIDYSSLI
jgi:predicted phage terminase large subunit-like protein